MAAVYPLYLTNLEGLLAVVIGGGIVGERKVTGLLAAGVPTRLISPAATPRLQEWAAEGHLEWLARPYQPGDLVGATLVFAATNQRAVNAEVAQAARQANILCNVADAPAEGDFHVPAVHRQDDLVVAVGTGGRSPRRATAVRDQIAAWLKNG
jgi:cobalt-precorrin 5A hydrolase/precorrin-3B C17-methyltransferase